ncbi:MAG: bifunctional adenosylcobinamide kinase/adenosylcobinamide-phosphate guanylyltransferase [Opitutaceae bacterium]|nr:bifunctional adenosylcobinamide kinase/adenosylcobinamide-phosphate guanylyltransferase [Cytophagales bacterium]
MIVYISGGVRSGKSKFAQQMALRLSESPVYVATAKIWDKDFEQRIKLHQQDRGPEWTNFETTSELYKLPIDGRVVVIDCVTLWLTNFFTENNSDISTCLDAFKNEIDELNELKATLIIISNEIGMGLHAESSVGRKFADLQGLANQYVASKAKEAIFMVSGLPLYLKTA